MTSIYELDLYALKIYLQTKNDFYVRAFECYGITDKADIHTLHIEPPKLYASTQVVHI